MQILTELHKAELGGDRPRGRVGPRGTVEWHTVDRPHASGPRGDGARGESATAEIRVGVDTRFVPAIIALNPDTWQIATHELQINGPFGWMWKIDKLLTGSPGSNIFQDGPIGLGGYYFSAYYSQPMAPAP